MGGRSKLYRYSVNRVASNDGRLEIFVEGHFNRSNPAHSIELAGYFIHPEKTCKVEILLTLLSCELK